MADFATALRARLIADAGVSALIGTRVYWMIPPQGSALPAIRLQAPSNLSERHLKGDAGVRSVRLQIDSFALSFGASLQLAEVARSALLLPATVGGMAMVTSEAEAPTPERGEDTPEGHIYWTRVDLRVWLSLA